MRSWASTGLPMTRLARRSMTVPTPGAPKPSSNSLQPTMPLSVVSLTMWKLRQPASQASVSMVFTFMALPSDSFEHHLADRLAAFDERVRLLQVHRVDLAVVLRHRRLQRACIYQRRDFA